MFGKLYIVATPIGNLGDISSRALSTLKEVDIILTEDTRVTAKLLVHYGISNSVLSYHQHTGDNKKSEILGYILSGKNVALVTDAGTPGVSDPGNELIAFLVGHEPEIEIVPIPGASSVTAALSICGFNVSKFTFLGFFPKKGKNNFISTIKNLNHPVVFFESPYRIAKLIDLLIIEVWGQRKIFVGQELTKFHERVLRTTLEEAKEKLNREKDELGRIKGELVVIIDA